VPADKPAFGEPIGTGDVPVSSWRSDRPCFRGRRFCGHAESPVPGTGRRDKALGPSPADDWEVDRLGAEEAAELELEEIELEEIELAIVFMERPMGQRCEVMSLS
jgi:hypothetical protein